MKTCRVVELGRMGYAEAFELQQRLVAARKKDAAPDVLLLCEHPPTITLGRNGDLGHLRMSREDLPRLGIEFHHANRGGDITYHGPGQIVGYPILQLGEIRRDVGWYVRQLEEAMIRATAAFGIAAFRVPGRTGVWTRANATSGTAPQEQKLGAIGVHLSRWVTAHGFAYNVSTDLSYFDLIVPCGIAGCRATSLEKLIGGQLIGERLTGGRLTRMQVLPEITAGFAAALGLELADATREELDEWIRGATEPVGVAS
jgi:lipoyl(octanoyl) transferase